MPRRVTCGRSSPVLFIGRIMLIPITICYALRMREHRKKSLLKRGKEQFAAMLKE
jgi:hypothetical protein